MGLEDILDEIIKGFPRDQFRRLILDELTPLQFDKLLNLPPKLPKGIVFRGEHKGPIKHPSGIFIAEWARHALYYAAGDDIDTLGYLSIYKSKIDTLPRIKDNTPILNKIFEAHFEGVDLKGIIPEPLYAEGGVVILGLEDSAFGENLQFGHSYPQGLIWDSSFLVQL